MPWQWAQLPVVPRWWGRVSGVQKYANDDELWRHVNGENTDGADIVMWYVAHLSHEAHDGGDEWHVCGPILRQFGY
ncbi:hypothetical protein ACQPW1_30855 [Nocardia sp. CA-128927]|uniref:hypothetical protein n=1 Tax=Nocardia sp. CA-128927 TaxID=3239975 RepID=UPI003D99310C